MTPEPAAPWTTLPEITDLPPSTGQPTELSCAVSYEKLLAWAAAGAEVSGCAAVRRDGSLAATAVGIDPEQTRRHLAAELTGRDGGLIGLAPLGGGLLVHCVAAAMTRHLAIESVKQGADPDPLGGLQEHLEDLGAFVLEQVRLTRRARGQAMHIDQTPAPTAAGRARQIWQLAAQELGVTEALRTTALMIHGRRVLGLRLTARPQ